MLYRLFTPKPELADIIISYWYARIDRNCCATQQYTTPLFEGLIFNFTQLKEYVQHEDSTELLTKTAYFSGQVTGNTAISGCPENDGYIIGVRFKPLGLAKITGINIRHLINANVDAEEVWGNELAWLCEAMQEAKSTDGTIRILEDFLIKQRRKIRLHPRADNVAQAITLMEARQGNISCETLQELTNTGKKTLERAFMNFHGMYPKMYIRIIRFNRAKQMIDHGLHPNLTELAYHLGYFDQSHFIKDFKKFSGQTPTEYLKTMEEERRRRTIPVD